MELTLDLNKRYTYADYLTWIDDVRRELLEGLIKLMPAPRDLHVDVSYNISLRLGLFLLKNNGKCKVRPAPFDVRFPINGETEDGKIYTVLQPDISVICDLSKLDEYGCLGAPDMIVEVLSPSTASRDLKDKFDIYEKHGVREYWIVYPKDKAVNIFLLQDDGKYDAGRLYDRAGQIPVNIFDGYSIDFDDIFNQK